MVVSASWCLGLGVGIRVVAVDIGSVGPPSPFAWAAFEVPNLQPSCTGDDPETAVDALIAGVGQDHQAALLLEAPMAVPVPRHDGWRGLGKARCGEGNRPWSAGAGAGALATGLAQAAWMLGAITTQLDIWRRGDAQLLLAEAFVSGTGKPVPVTKGQHFADAVAAGKEFVRRLSAKVVGSDVQCEPMPAFNLLAAAALWAGLSPSHDELRKDVTVVRVRPIPDEQ
jgi:hypothetical protein